MRFGGSAGKAGRTVVVFWQFFPAEQVQPVLDEFMKQNPDIEVRMEQLTWQSGLEKITASVAAGNAPDLCELGSTWFPRFAHQGALADWSDSAAALQAELTGWDMARVGGKTYGLPWLVGTRALFWNKELFARAGIDTTRGPATWAELTDAARRVNALGDGVAGWGANAGERYVLFKKVMPFCWGAGGALLTPDGTASAFDSPANVEGVAQYLALAKLGRVDRQEQVDDAFLAGKVGATISGSWLLRKAPKQAPDLRFGVSAHPAAGARSRPLGLVPRRRAAGVVRAVEEPGGGVAAGEVSHFEENASLAVARVNQAVQPAAVGAIDDPFYAGDPHQRALLEQLATAVPTPNHPAWLDMESAIEDEVEKALYGKQTAAQAVAAASAKIDALAKAAPAP